MRPIIPAVLVAMTAAGALAVTPATDLFLPSVGHAQGACPGGVCSQWRSDTWIYNPSTTQPATVVVAFLRRDTANLAPPTVTVAVAAQQTVELADVVLSSFAVADAYGALRFTADIPVVVTGRVYDANVQTNKGTGTAGQFFAGLPASIAIASGESTDIIGLAYDSEGIWRSNFGFVETTGAPATVEVQRLDEHGAVQGSKSYPVREREARQFPLTDIAGPLGGNVRLRVRVSAGSGRVVAFGSRLDNRTGDPSTVEMAVAGGRDGTYLCKAEKTTYDTPLTVTVSGGTVTALDATVLVTAEDVPSCSGGELVAVAGALPEPAVIDETGAVSFEIGGSAGGVTVRLQLTATFAPSGRVTGTVSTTMTGAGSCSGSKTWPLVGARLPQ